MNRKEFFSKLSGMSSGDLVEVQLMYWLAKNAHRVQTRDGGQRYFEHPRDVALLLIERGFKTKSIINKALGHDIIEDTNTPFQIITDLFGHDLWHSLLILSKKVPVFDPVTGQIFGSYKKLDADYYAELMKADFEDRLVKCADRSINLGDMNSWVRDRQVQYAEHTQQYVLPLAKITDVWFFEQLAAKVSEVLAS